MKTQAFLIRALLCFLFSFIPLKEFELRILETRIETRGALSSDPILVGSSESTLRELKSNSRVAPWIVPSCLNFALIVASGLIILYYPVVVSAVLMLAISTFGVGIGFQVPFHFFNFYIPSAGIIASLLMTYLIFTGYRLAFQENMQWRALKQAQYLRELDQMKSNFLSLLSHDLKTPLAKIQAGVERMRIELEQPPEKQSNWTEMIDSIENSNNEMKRFISSIIHLSRLESQELILNKRTNDINVTIGQALRRLSPLAAQKKIEIKTELEPIFSIEFDEDLMRQVITNLIDNAIRFSPEGSSIIIRSLEKDHHVCVEVQDFGFGIPKNQLPQVFRKFSRLQNKMNQESKGSGLGLYLSRYFIELHGGSIRVQSKEGEGATFSFMLPLGNSESQVVLG